MSKIEEFKKLYNNFEFEEIKAKDYKEIEKFEINIEDNCPAVEQYAFSYDIVEQCYGRFEKLADDLYKNM